MATPTSRIGSLGIMSIMVAVTLVTLLYVVYLSQAAINQNNQTLSFLRDNFNETYLKKAQAEDKQTDRILSVVITLLNKTAD